MLFAVRCSDLLDLCGALLRTGRSRTCAVGANLCALKPTNGAEMPAHSAALKQSLQPPRSRLCSTASSASAAITLVPLSHVEVSQKVGAVQYRSA
jgi:hypothetical protein